jgi:hypothetical protein
MRTFFLMVGQFLHADFANCARKKPKCHPQKKLKPDKCHPPKKLKPDKCHPQKKLKPDKIKGD